LKHRLFCLDVEVLDDSTFDEQEMVDNVHEALKIHLEAIGVDVTLKSVSIVLLDEDNEVAEA
jgi:hypothetical protein